MTRRTQLPTGCIDIKPVRGAAFDERYSIQPESGCWIWLGAVNDKGYGQIKINGVTTYAHRLSYERKYGPITETMELLHSCDVPSCVNPAHLTQGSHKKNMEDMAKRGRSSKTPKNFGEGHNRGKLKEPDIMCIRADSRTHKTIALEHGVSEQSIWCIKNRRTWRHV